MALRTAKTLSAVLSAVGLRIAMAREKHQEMIFPDRKNQGIRNWSRKLGKGLKSQGVLRKVTNTGQGVRIFVQER